MLEDYKQVHRSEAKMVITSVTTYFDGKATTLTTFIYTLHETLVEADRTFANATISKRYKKTE